MKITTRKQAIQQGFKRYFTGKLCKRGHVVERRVADHHCIKCDYPGDPSTRRTCQAKHRAILVRNGYFKNYCLKQKYGITQDQYKELLKQQDHKCAGCRKHRNEFKKELAVDHDHKTGQIRGLLCESCNRALGLLHDNPRACINLYKYLTKITT